MVLQGETNEPFVIQLIKELKKKEFISSAIMLPLLLGAYKMKENFNGEDYLEFFDHVYNDLIESLYKGSRYLYFRKCEASDNFVFEPVDSKPQKCNATITYEDQPVIYCKDEILGSDCKIDAYYMRIYFLNKLIKQTVRYCDFVDTIADISDFTPGMHEINTLKEVIKSILKK